MAQRPRRGFTLIEMMVVLFISMTMILLILPIFQVTTYAVRVVERKLAVYEAARVILDMYEAELLSAVADQRGNHFSLKKLAWDDQDAFTPDGTQKFSQSRRQADMVHYMKVPSTVSDFYAQGMSFAGAQLGGHYSAYRSDLHVEALMNVLHYKTAAQRDPFLKDVSTLETYGVDKHNCERTSTTYVNPPLDMTIKGYSVKPAAVDFLAPGHECYAPYDTGNIGTGLTRIALLDFNVSYWDAAARKFKDLADDTAAYFAPPPRALRITITVCDAGKRDRVTLCRVIRIPVGTGDGAIENEGAADGDYLTPSPYNRAKNLRTLEPTLFQ